MLTRAAHRRLLFVLVPILAGTVGLLLWHAGSIPAGATEPALDSEMQATADPAEQRLIDKLVATAADLPGSKITVDYPQQETIFPPEIFAPTFLWHDDAAENDRWLLDIALDDGASHLRLRVSALPPPQGEIDPRCISTTNEIYEPTEHQASAKSWRPQPALWSAIKQGSVARPATLTFYGYNSANPDRVVSKGSVTIRTSVDRVGAPIFYRDVPLMPTPTVEGVIQPLAPGSMPLIEWRLRDISRPDSRLMLSDMPTCANCHSFSADGTTMGMDVDGPQGDKGAYGIVPLERETVFSKDKVITWNRYPGRAKNHHTLGFLARVSPNGRYAIATVNEALFVVNFQNFRFSQVFYPTRGVLAVHDRETGEIRPLPGAADTNYVHCDPVWSADGKTIVFARAEARAPYILGRPLPKYVGDPNETPIQYNLYRLPFNDGRGGTPEPVSGASHNGMSNTFPKISPDGKWIVFTQCKNGQLMRPDGKLQIVPLEGGAPRLMNCNLPLMNSWHSFSPNGKWLVFSSKSNTPYTQMFLTHIDENGNDSPAILLENSTAANRAVNIPEFVNVDFDDFLSLSVPAVEHYRFFEKGNDLARDGRFREAVTEFERALEGSEENEWRVYDWRFHENLSTALLDLGRNEEALHHVHESLRLNPANVGMQTNLGFLLSSRGQYGQALQHLSTAIQLEPKVAVHWFNRATVQLKIGDYEKAVADYTRAIELEPDHAEALGSRGIALRALERNEEALADFAEAIRIDPSLPAPWYFRGLIRLEAGELEAAQADLSRALELLPENSPQVGDVRKMLRQIAASLETQP